MKIQSAFTRPYALPLRRPWAAAKTVMARREGFLIALTADDGLTGWGDCAPLPSAAPRQRRALAEAWQHCLRILPGMSEPDALARCGQLATGELRWALETALHDLAARRAGLPLARYLGAERFSGRVAVNAALGALDAQTAQRAAAALEQGYKVAKIKLGLNPIAQELGWLEELNTRCDGALRLRLDANRAWPLAQARQFLKALTALPIEAVEEPLAEPDLRELKALQEALPFSLALDESLGLFPLKTLFTYSPVRRWVVKPARFGGMMAALELAAQARMAGVELVLTSVVDSSVGVAAGAQLAAALAPDMAHGFATLPWLVNDVAQPPSLHDGYLCLGLAPGLGLTPER